MFFDRVLLFNAEQTNEIFFFEFFCMLVPGEVKGDLVFFDRSFLTPAIYARGLPVAGTSFQKYSIWWRFYSKYTRALTFANAFMRLCFFLPFLFLPVPQILNSRPPAV